MTTKKMLLASLLFFAVFAGSMSFYKIQKENSIKNQEMAKANCPACR